MKVSFLIYIVLYTYLISCTTQEETGMLTGEISGKITLLDQNQYYMHNNSGVSIEIINKELKFEAITDSNGYFSIKDIPYNTYSVSVSKEGFYAENNNIRVNHVGGISSTIVDYYLQQIPVYKIYIDSLVLDTITYQYSDQFRLYGTIAENNREPYYRFYSLRGFISDKPEISSDLYLFNNCAFIDSFEGNKISGYFPQFFNMEFKKYGTLYFLFYPEPLGICNIYPARRFFGKPSNIVSYTFK